MRPDEQFLATTRARTQTSGCWDDRKGWGVGRRSPLRWDELSETEQFGALVKEHGRELTKFVKRVRSNSGHRGMRILMVAEKHKSGLPHFHVLFHEVDALNPIRKAVLSKAWRMGYSTFTLVKDARAATYVCKYLAKDALTRVRASANYGTHEVSPLQRF